MKKLCLLLLVALSVLCLSFTAFASESDLALAVEANASIVKVGNTVEVAVSATENAGFLAAALDVKYDATVLEYVGYSCEDSIYSGVIAVDELRAGNLQIHFGDAFEAFGNVGNKDAACDETGALVTLTFTALEVTESTAVSVDAISANIFDTNATFAYDVEGAETTVAVVDANYAVPKFSNVSLTLKDSLALNYKFAPVAGYTDYFVKFVFAGKETVVTDYVVDGGRYVFTFTDIAPQMMGDDVVATLYAKFAGQEVKCFEYTYSAAKYCYAVLGTTKNSVNTLIVDLLNYGAAAQQYRGYKLDSLVNAQLTDTQAAFGTADVPAVENKLNAKYAVVENATVTWKTAFLALEDRVSFNLAFAADSVEGLTVKVVAAGKTWEISSDEFVAKDGKYYVSFSGLNAGQMREIIYVTVYDGETAVSNTLAYSVESYVAQNMNASANLKNLIVALIKYGDAAAAYAN